MSEDDSPVEDDEIVDDRPEVIDEEDDPVEDDEEIFEETILGSGRKILHISNTQVPDKEREAKLIKYLFPHVARHEHTDQVQ